MPEMGVVEAEEEMDRTKQNKSVIPRGRVRGALLLGRRVGPPRE